MAAEHPPSPLPSSRPRRRFLPQPYETTTSRSPARGDNKPPSNPPTIAVMSSPEPHTPDDKPQKRFRVQPLETTSRSSRKHITFDDPAALPPSDSSVSPSKSPARQTFAVEPLETTTRSSRMSNASSTTSDDTMGAVKTEDTSKKPARRKFKVEVIETANRSRKVGDPAPADLIKRIHLPPDDVLRAANESHRDAAAGRPTQPRSASNPAVPLLQLSKPLRQGSMHPHYNSRVPSRAHSFRVPDLESIESSGSGRSPASGDASPASTTDSYKDATRMRESVDDRFSGYLLALAARAAEKQLREQEAALFPTVDSHEHIAHYVDSDESDEVMIDPTTGSLSIRRGSDDYALALKELQQYGERKKREAREAESVKPPAPGAVAAQRKRTGAFNVEFDVEAKQDAWIQAPTPKNLIGGHQKDPDLKQMRKAAAPPMLGGDMEFPRCPSPEHARFDVTQGSDFLRNSMCYLTNQENGGERLWDGKSSRAQLQRSAASTTRVPQVSKDSQKPKGGLWGGHCNASDAKMFATPIGLVTPKASPALEKDDPFSMLSHAVSAPQPGPTANVAVRLNRAPPSPPASNSSHTTARDPNVDARLVTEFPDSFVTQVYNYLSLGFPALARKFDDELAKISGVPIHELRHDDRLAEQRGYIRLGADEVGVGIPAAAAFDPDAADAMSLDGSVDEVEVHAGMCRRWCALRTYVREWGRQMGVGDPNGDLTKLDPRRAWGLPARKGSWGN